jgi:hypothetical protein
MLLLQEGTDAHVYLKQLYYIIIFNNTINIFQYYFVHNQLVITNETDR